MVQVDILLKNLQREYDITIGRNRTFDVSIDEEVQSHDVYIYDLFDRQSIYGDELYPLIFHLTQNNIEYLLDVSLFPDSFLYGYDDRLISMMDSNTLFALEHAVSYNYIPIKSSDVKVDGTIYTELEPQNTRLVYEDDMPILLAGTIEVNDSQLSLTTIGDVINNKLLSPKGLNARLLDDITEDVQTESYVAGDGDIRNNLSLDMYVGEIVDSKRVDLERQIARLISEVGIAASTRLLTSTSGMMLTTEGEVTNITRIKDLWLRSTITDGITKDLQNICEIMLNATGIHWLDGYLYEYDDMLLHKMDLTYPKMSLVSECGKIYIKFAFDIEEATSSLKAAIQDFTSVVSLHNDVVDTMKLESNIDFDYTVMLNATGINWLDGYLYEYDDLYLDAISSMRLSMAMSSTDVELVIYTDLNPVGMQTSISNEMVLDLRETIGLDIIADSTIDFTVAEEMESHWGLGRYDDKYLYYWDDYTISDMSAEIVNRTQSGSVDM